MSDNTRESSFVNDQTWVRNILSATNIPVCRVLDCDNPPAPGSQYCLEHKEEFEVVPPDDPRDTDGMFC